MDIDRFDRFARWFGALTVSHASRRAVVFSGAALLIVGGAGVRTGAEAAGGCRKDDAVCDPKRPRQCCSGTCKKSGKTHKCAPTPDALGCTVRDDFCAAGNAAKTCPDSPGDGCVIRDDGRPFCAHSGQCFPCETDADCDQAFMAKGGVCITRCPLCPTLTRSFCAFPPLTS